MGRANKTNKVGDHEVIPRLLWLLGHSVLQLYVQIGPACGPTRAAYVCFAVLLVIVDNHSPRRGRQLLFTAQTSTGARQCKLVASCSGAVRKSACSTCFLLVKPCTWSRARSRCVGEAILLCSSGWLDSLDRHDLALPRQPLTRQLSSSEKKPHGGLRFCMSRLDSRHV